MFQKLFLILERPSTAQTYEEDLSSETISLAIYHPIFLVHNTTFFTSCGAENFLFIHYMYFWRCGSSKLMHLTTKNMGKHGQYPHIWLNSQSLTTLARKFLVYPGLCNIAEKSLITYLSKLSLSGLAAFSSGVRYTMGTPGALGLSATITRSPVQVNILFLIQQLKFYIHVHV